MSFIFAECALWLPTLNDLIIIIKIMTRSISVHLCVRVFDCVCVIGVHVRRFNARRLSVRWVRKLHEIGFIYVFCFDYTLQHTHGIFVIQMERNADRSDVISIISTASEERKWCLAWTMMQFMIITSPIRDNFRRIQLITIAGHIVESWIAF